MFVTGKTLAQMWPNLGAEKKPRSCAKTMAPLSLCEMTHQKLSTFLGMKCPYLMASAQKNNKTNGIVTQTWQKDMKSIAKRQTTLDPQTSKGQRRHVQFPTRRDDYHWCPIDRSLSSWWRNHQLDLVKQDSARWSCMIIVIFTKVCNDSECSMIVQWFWMLVNFVWFTQ